MSRAVLLRVESDAADRFHTGLQDIAAFVRRPDSGIFISLDFPWSRIVTENGLTRVTYPPYRRLHPGLPYACHSLTVGAAKPSGESRYGRDTGEVEAMDAYVQGRYPRNASKSPCS